MSYEELEHVNTLLDKAIGGRRLRQFAEQLGLNVSTISRIRSGQIRLSPELIQKIVDNAEQPGTVTTEMFYSLPPETHTRYHRNRFDEMKELESRCTGIIMMDLLQRGYTLSSSSDNQKNFDWAVKTDAIENNAERVWGFEFLLPLPGRNSKVGDYNDGSFFPHLWRCMSALYLGTAHVDRMSFVTDDVAYYRWLRKKCIDMRPLGEVSLILVDREKRAVAEEHILPPADGHIPAAPFKNN